MYCDRILPVKDKKIVLASSSPRRRQLLGLGNWNFVVRAAAVDESRQPGEHPKDYVLRLAQQKALAVRDQADPEDIILGSDTAVVDGEDILGKPADEADAERMLIQLRGKTHQVYTGIALYRAGDAKMHTEFSITDVSMRGYSDAEIQAYIKTGDPMDKAGAYAIQHPDFQPVHSMQGCYAGVMGLALCHVLRALKTFGLPPAPEDVPAACQALLRYDCPVSSAILRGENPSSSISPSAGTDSGRVS